MPTFLVISRHSPENCPMFNDKARKVSANLQSKLEGLLKKHGVKLVGAWGIPTEHENIMVFEAPSLDSYQKFGMEPEIVALSEFETYEVKLAFSMEEGQQIMQQFLQQVK